MVYLPPRADNGSVSHQCKPPYYHPDDDDEAYKCLQAGEKPYCWPRNGTRICGGGYQMIPLYWSPAFYQENAWFFVDFGNQVSEAWQGPSNLRAHQANSTGLTGYEEYVERASNGTWAGEQILRITIREFWPNLDSLASAVHEGPTLILEAPRATATATSSSIASPGRHSPDNDEAKLIGTIVGSCVGGILLIILLYLCCGRCCGGCCGFAGHSENERVKRLEARRLERDGESQIDEAMKVERQEVQTCTAQVCPVRPGGMWAMDMPRRASRLASTASDEIRAVDIVEEQRAEERRVEERRAGEQRQDIARAEEMHPPAYEEAPPKYTP